MKAQQDRAAIHRVGIGTDLHRLGSGTGLRLGHVNVPSDQGTIAHSDGDVVLHAVIDALAGAAGLPDIGEMFPDTDPAHKDADSGPFLEEAIRRVAARGYAVVNADVTIHLQRPKLVPHKPAIRGEVARLLGVSEEAVSIKAKTGEGVDAVGRGEAVSCTVVVGLTKVADRGASHS